MALRRIFRPARSLFPFTMINVRRFAFPAVTLTILSLTTSIAGAASIQEYLAAAPFKMPTVPVPSFPERKVPITDFGAVGDGHTLNTAAFAKAIDACAQAGGGHVVVPAGLWLTGPIVLKSNVDQ